MNWGYLAVLRNLGVPGGRRYEVGSREDLPRWGLVFMMPRGRRGGLAVWVSLRIGTQACTRPMEVERQRANGSAAITNCLVREEVGRGSRCAPIRCPMRQGAPFRWQEGLPAAVLDGEPGNGVPTRPFRISNGGSASAIMTRICDLCGIGSCVGGLAIDAR